MTSPRSGSGSPVMQFNQAEFRELLRLAVQNNGRAWTRGLLIETVTKNSDAFLDLFLGPCLKADPSVGSPPALDLERAVALLENAAYRWGSDAEQPFFSAEQQALFRANGAFLRALASALPEMARDAERWREGER